MSHNDDATVTLKAKICDEFGYAQSYRALKRENPQMAADWRQMVQQVKDIMISAEKAFTGEHGDTDQKALTLLGALNHAADAANDFNEATGKRAFLETTITAANGQKLFTAKSKLRG